ncbi:hypothetical protein [Flavobacterium sp. 25HG05S-40]
MKKVLLACVLCFSMSFALSVGTSDKQNPTTEQPQLFSISSNAP